MGERHFGTRLTVVMWSCFRELVQRSESLLSKGDEQGATPLHRAAFRNQDRAVARLLQLGADSGLAGFASGNTPLMVAAAAGNQQVVARLAAAGASLDHQNARGYTALMVATTQSNPAAVQYLLDLGC